jgi:hypothetical protein
VPKHPKKKSQKKKKIASHPLFSPLIPSFWFWHQFFRHYEIPKRRDEIRTGDRTRHWTGEEFTKNFSENGTKVDNFKYHGDVNNSLLSGIIILVLIAVGSIFIKFDTRALSILVWYLKKKSLPTYWYYLCHLIKKSWIVVLNFVFIRIHNPYNSGLYDFN